MHVSGTRLIRGGLAVVAALALGSLAACGSDDSGSSANAATGSAAGAAAKAEVAKYSGPVQPPKPAALSKPVDLSGKTVWYIPLVGKVPVIASVGDAMTAALEKVGASVHVCDGNALPTTIASCMSNAIAQKADAVVTSFVDYTMVPAGFQQLEDAGIPVLVGAAVPTGGKESSTSLSFFDVTPATNKRAALAGEYVVADSNGEAHVLVTRLTDSETTKASAQNVLDALAKCDDCEVKTIDMKSSGLDKYGAAVSSALATDPEITYLVTPADSYDVNALSGIRSAGFGNKVKIVTVSASVVGLQEIQAGTTLADVSLSPTYEGWAFADALIRQLSGEVPQPISDATLRIFTKDNVGDLTLTADEFNSNHWYGDDSFQDDFLAAWGVK